MQARYRQRVRASPIRGTTIAAALTAKFSDGSVYVVKATKISRNVQHFYVTSMGTLLSASTDLPGRLVLSDYTCEDVKK